LAPRVFLLLSNKTYTDTPTSKTVISYPLSTEVSTRSLGAAAAHLVATYTVAIVAVLPNMHT